jgi:hypothetical protein
MARRGITGRKPDSSAEAVDGAPVVAPAPRLAMTIEEFCESFCISEGFYYKLKKQGLGPREMRIGTRTIISIESATAWGREHEFDGASEAAPRDPLP